MAVTKFFFSNSFSKQGSVHQQVPCKRWSIITIQIFRRRINVWGVDSSWLATKLLVIRDLPAKRQVPSMASWHLPNHPREESIYKTPKTMLGWLNHFAIIVALSSYLPNRIRRYIDHTSSKMPNHNKSSRKLLGRSVLEVLLLFSKTFLHKAHNEISMSLITYRHPTHILWTNACPSSLGVFKQTQGQHGNFRFPAQPMAPWIPRITDG